MRIDAWKRSKLTMCVVLQGAVVARGKGEYPERVGQPECQVGEGGGEGGVVRRVGRVDGLWRSGCAREEVWMRVRGS